MTHLGQGTRAPSKTQHAMLQSSNVHPMFLFGVCAHSLHCRLEQLVQEYRKLYARKDQHGVTDKDTKSMHRSMKRKRSTMSNVLQQLEAWASYTGTKDGLISESTLSAWLESGDAPEFVSNDIQLGKQLYMAEQDVERCEEERCVLKVEIDRLCAWLDRKLQLAVLMHGVHEKRSTSTLCIETAARNYSMGTTVQKLSCLTHNFGEQLLVAKHVVALRDHLAHAKKVQVEISARVHAVVEAQALEAAVHAGDLNVNVAA